MNIFFFLSFLFSLVFSRLVSDVQHLVMDSVPFSAGPRGPGSTVQRGELCVSGQTGADHRRPEPDALPEGCHQGNVTVSYWLFGSFSLMFLYFDHVIICPHDVRECEYEKPNTVLFYQASSFVALCGLKVKGINSAGLHVELCRRAPRLSEGRTQIFDAETWSDEATLHVAWLRCYSPSGTGGTKGRLLVRIILFGTVSSILVTVLASACVTHSGVFCFRPWMSSFTCTLYQWNTPIFVVFWSVSHFCGSVPRAWESSRL